MRRSIRGLVALFFLSSLGAACSGPKGPGDLLPSGAVGDVDAPDVPEECPSGLTPWPSGGCAPRVDECPNPWELPLIGGGCMAIGPRACPKTWDPEADVDCEAGTLMEYDGSPCPEGFVLTEDEVACIPFFEENCGEMEIPVLGGGCKKVGPDWYDPEAPNSGLDVPYFDECGPGLLALEGGGCVQVGPRACPKLWDPEADVDCEVGDVLPCPEGWSESEDGMYCDPKYADCGPGERSLVGGGCQRVVPLAEDCPPGPFPAVPEGAKDVVYVSAASACTEGCGTAEAPFKTISAAVAAVAGGGYVLVGAGEYAEGLLIQKPVHVIGLCSAKVAIAGTASVVTAQKSAVDAAGIAVTDTSDVELSGLKVASAAVGLAVAGGKAVEVHQLEVTGSAGVGAYVGPGSDVAIDHLWLHDTVPGSKVWLLFGVFVEGGGKLAVKNSLIDATRGAGLYASDGNTEASLDGVSIRGTQCVPSGVAGYGARVNDKATLRITDSLLERNRTAGIVAEDGCIVEVDSSEISKTQQNDQEEFGWGLQLYDGSNVTVTGCLLEGNMQVGLLVYEPGTKVELSATAVTKTTQGKGDVCVAAAVWEGAALSVTGCLFDANSELGLAAWNPGTSLGVSATVVRDTMPNAKGNLGQAMRISDGASASISSCLFEGNSEVGVSVADVGTELTLSTSVVRDTMPNGEGEAGYGMVVSDGGSVVASGCVFDRNMNLGIVAGHPGTKVDLSASVVRDTKPDGDGWHGFGLQLVEGSSSAVSGCLLEGNRGIGIVVADQSTTVDLSTTVVRNTTPDADVVSGFGMCVKDGAWVSVSDCLLERNSGLGVQVAGPGTEADISATVVWETLPSGGGQGVGMQVGDGATVVVSGCRLEGNTEVGIVTMHSGTTATLSATVIRDTMPNAGGHLGVGMQVGEGAEVSVAECLFVGNTNVGINVAGSGTMVHMSSTTVRDTVPNAEGDYGYGIQVANGASASATACQFAHDAGLGISVWGPDAAVDLSASVVRDTLSNGEEMGGRGLQAKEGSAVSASGCLFEGNSGLGISVAHSGTKMQLSTTVVRDTVVMQDGNGGFGYGIQIAKGASAAVSGCMIDANADVGVLVGRLGSTADLVATIVRDTMPVSDAGGIGVMVQEGASASAVETLLVNNATAGAFATGGDFVVDGSSLLVDASAVINTEQGGSGAGGGYQVYGDGIVADQGCAVDVVSSVISGNGRNGIYFNQAFGSVIDSVIVSNEFYGLAMEQCADLVEWEGKGNFILGNATGMPPDKAAQVTTSTGGMAVPPAPEMMDVPSGPVD